MSNRPYSDKRLLSKSVRDAIKYEVAVRAQTGIPAHHAYVYKAVQRLLDHADCVEEQTGHEEKA